MDDHRKPTVEELEAENKRILDQLEKEEKDNTPPKDDDDEDIVTPTPSPSAPPDDNEDDEEPSPSDEVPSPSAPPADDEEEEKLEDKKTPTAEERLKESTREAQRLFDKNRRMNDALQKAQEVPEPTEEEVKAEFPEWDDMSATERKLATDNLWNKKKLSLVTDASAEIKAHEAWVKDVKGFVDDPANLVKYPELEGKTEEFKTFAADPKRRNQDFDEIVLTFNGYLAKSAPAPKKGQMFPRGNGGPKEKKDPNDGKLTVEESARLRETNYAEYRKKLQEGKIVDL